MLGRTLRQAREARALPLREVEWATKIKAEHLAALEEENFDRLPGAVYTRGYLRSYAQYLGLDPEPLIAEYNIAYQPATEIVSTRPAVKIERRRLAVTRGLIAAVIMIAIATAFSVYLKLQFDHYRATQAAANVSPSPVVILSPATLPSASPSAAVSPSPSPVYTGVTVAVRVDEAVWLRVEVDGQVDPQTGTGGKTFPAGSTLTFQGKQSVHLRSGKASHTFVNVNGRDLGKMPAAESGDIGDQTYQKGGV
jgi:cytoskeletal protein RodZ